MRVDCPSCKGETKDVAKVVCPVCEAVEDVPYWPVTFRCPNCTNLLTGTTLKLCREDGYVCRDCDAIWYEP